MKRLISFVLVIFLLLSLIGCGKSEQVLLSNEAVKVVRTGREIRVTDADTGAECVYTIVRTKRDTNKAARENSVGSLRVIAGRGVMVISTNGEHWIVRFG